MSALHRFTDLFTKLDQENLNLLDEIYDPDIIFSDPAHTIHGLVELRNYFQALYINTTIRFEFSHQHEIGNQAYLQWVMHFSNPRLNRGAEVTVEGMSFLEFGSSGKVRGHRDYFDLGAMVYEQLPLLGGIIRSVKKRIGT